jgi:hypothetical protein
VDPGVTTDNRGSSRTLIQQLTSRLGSSTDHRPVPYNDEVTGSSPVTPTSQELTSDPRSASHPNRRSGRLRGTGGPHAMGKPWGSNRQLGSACVEIPTNRARPVDRRQLTTGAGVIGRETSFTKNPSLVLVGLLVTTLSGSSSKPEDASGHDRGVGPSTTEVVVVVPKPVRL